MLSPNAVFNEFYSFHTCSLMALQSHITERKPDRILAPIMGLTCQSHLCRQYPKVIDVGRCFVVSHANVED